MSRNDDSKYPGKMKQTRKGSLYSTSGENTNGNGGAGINAAALKNVRIIQKHLVYVIGLSSNLANKDVYF